MTIHLTHYDHAIDKVRGYMRISSTSLPLCDFTIEGDSGEHGTDIINQIANQVPDEAMPAVLYFAERPRAVELLSAFNHRCHDPDAMFLGADATFFNSAIQEF